MDPTTLCPGCFALIGKANPCPHCGFDKNAPRPVQALPVRTLLNQQFLVGRVLGKPGGFGITYLAWDQLLEARVAIKEYLPRELAVRAQDSRTLHPHSQDEIDLFRYGLEQFMAEARTLAKLDHPNLVRVRQFFEANGTAYLVMDYYRGCSLAEHLERQPDSRMREPDALALMQPILDGLRAVHAKGFLHRDIKPQNIYLAQTDSGGVRPILLDFGAARQAMGERSRSLSVVISPGYAPFEQYHRKGQQGPATDIYGAAAVLYRMLTGVVPPEATERMAGDDLRPAADFGVSAPVSAALEQALAMSVEARPGTVAGFQEVLMPPMARPEPGLPRGAALPRRNEPEHQQQLTGDENLRKPSQTTPTTASPHGCLSWIGLGVIIVGLSVGLVIMETPPRPPQMEERYSDHGDGTLTDLTTGLQWMRCSLGQEWTGSTCAGSAELMTWDAIMTNGQQKTWPEFAGYGDWRAPTIEELRTLIYCSSGQPAYWPAKDCSGNYTQPTIHSMAFPNTSPDWFWSVSPNASNSDYAWYLSFYRGTDGYNFEGNYCQVRLVRSGQ
ncbi:Serine/threonine-protein kinase StkP [Thiorhodovibrio winogradskyi]|uniref:non-specific serine/threonine protein kinase n=1 Tax=Thiorhodovibrio winogradskyi TaxID=77007 RepID=A0ABZ0SC36_9GAMM|nr:DUF1566 domain-containing protein [Thiorhodovibrio winogradskyi]